MQKGDIAKLKLLLAGISARMTKNRDYFIRAVCTFTSGKKKFDAELSLDGQDWALRFQGSTSPTDAAAFCALVPLRLKNLTRACLSIPSAALS